MFLVQPCILTEITALFSYLDRVFEDLEETCSASLPFTLLAQKQPEAISFDHPK